MNKVKAANLSLNEQGWVKAHMDALRKRVKEPYFTVNYSEHVGINSKDAGCIFEVEVETTLQNEPLVYIPVEPNLTILIMFIADEYASYN